jgi:hypothetical protein
MKQDSAVFIRDVINELRQKSIHDSSKKLTNHDLFILYDKNNDLIKFLIKTPESFNKTLIPGWKGVNFDFDIRSDMPFIELSISEDVENDKIFKELIVRIIEDQSNVKNEVEAFDAFLNTLNSFDSFFKNQRKGLSKPAQQGLYAELFILKNHIIPNSDIVSYAINNWRGPERAHQDFRFDKGNIEVKSTMQKDPINISISNEKQLDPRSLESINNKLLLYVLCLDEINPQENTLPSIVHEIYIMLDEHNSADRSAFTNRLNTAGYYEMHEEYYKDIGYYVRKEFLYNINSAIYFPSIIDLPLGVGDIKYTIDLSACTSSKIDIKEIKDIL